MDKTYLRQRGARHGNDEYHAHPALGSSGLKRFSITPAHYWASYLDPERESVDKSISASAAPGIARYSEPSEFESGTPPTTTRTQRRTKRSCSSVLAGEVALESLIALPEGLSPTQKSARPWPPSCKRPAARLAPRGFRFRLEWHLLLNGRDVARRKVDARRFPAWPTVHAICRSVASFLTSMRGTAWQRRRCSTATMERDRAQNPPLTTCSRRKLFPNGSSLTANHNRRASEDGFWRGVWNPGYGWQAALYPMVYQGVSSIRPSRPLFLLAQEKGKPYAARYYAAAQDLREHYLSKITDLMPSFAECQRLDRWAPYPPTVKTSVHRLGAEANRRGCNEWNHRGVSRARELGAAENCVTLACAAVVISATYACGGGAASWAGIVFL